MHVLRLRDLLLFYWSRKTCHRILITSIALSRSGRGGETWVLSNREGRQWRLILPAACGTAPFNWIHHTIIDKCCVIKLYKCNKVKLLISAICTTSSRRSRFDPMSIVLVCFPSQRPSFDPRSNHVGFVLDKLTRGQAFCEYFGFPCQFSFHQLLQIH
jgi:hypothetical protein